MSTEDLGAKRIHLRDYKLVGEKKCNRFKIETAFTDAINGWLHFLHHSCTFRVLTKATGLWQVETSFECNVIGFPLSGPQTLKNDAVELWMGNSLLYLAPG
jgi:hypothetical protein